MFSFVLFSHQYNIDYYVSSLMLNSAHSVALLRYEQLFYGPLIQDNPAEPVLSQRRDLLDSYDPDVLPATQPIMSKHYRKT